MTSPSRTTQITKLHKILKKYYKPVAPDLDRKVLEHLLFACCAENAHYEPAEQAFAALVHNFFDWNEVRVSSVRELAEVMPGLPDPPAAGNRVKRVLQSIFEATYDFTLEEFRKLNLGPASERLAKFEGTTSFTVAYVVQVALGGHAIPVDAGTLRALYTVRLVTEEDAKAGVVPGLERAVPKNKGLEFASLLHQLGADFTANPYTPALKEVLTDIEPEAAGRLPKRRAGRAAETPVERRRRRAAAKRARRAKKARKAAAAEKEAAEGKKETGGQAAAGKKKKKPAGDEPKSAVPKKKPAATPKKSSGKKKDSAASASSASGGKKSGEQAGLSKRKPR